MDTNTLYGRIAAWETAGLIDADTAEGLRMDVDADVAARTVVAPALADRASVARTVASVAGTSFALILGPFLVLLAAGARGRWMWIYTDEVTQRWQPLNWLLDWRLLASFAVGVALIALVEVRGGPRAAKFRAAVRLAPVTMLLPILVVLLADPQLPKSFAYAITTWGTASNELYLHQVLLVLATPLMFVGVLFPAWWLGTQTRPRSKVASIRQRFWLAVRVLLFGYLGASMVAAIPPFGLIFGVFIFGPTLVVLVLPGLVAAVSIWSRSLPDPLPEEPAASGLLAWVELGLLVGCGVLAGVAFTSMSG